MWRYGETKYVRLRVYLWQLLYEVALETYLSGRVSEADAKTTALLFATGDDEHIAKLRRSVSAAFADAGDAVAEYARGGSTECDNALAEECPEVLELVVRVPADYEEASTASACEALHEYVKCRALGDWFSVAGGEAGAPYAAAAEAALSQLKRCLDKRRRPPMHDPFIYRNNKED